MRQTLIGGGRRPWAAVLVVAVQIPGWTVVAGAYLLVLPLFGVVSPITWGATWAAWLYVMGTAWVAAGALAIARQWALAVVMGVMAVLAATGLWIVGTIEPTPSSQFHRHRDDLAVLAADFRRGVITGNIQLPWRMRWLSANGVAHRQCLSVDRDSDHEQCVLYLPVWQNWRGESGVGFGYFPEPPASGTFIATAAGDMGAPAYELGDGWWWVE